jgi:hypothetical protein
VQGVREACPRAVWTDRRMTTARPPTPHRSHPRRRGPRRRG